MNTTAAEIKEQMGQYAESIISLLVENKGRIAGIEAKLDRLEATLNTLVLPKLPITDTETVTRIAELLASGRASLGSMPKVEKRENNATPKPTP